MFTVSTPDISDNLDITPLLISFLNLISYINSILFLFIYLPLHTYPFRFSFNSFSTISILISLPFIIKIYLLTQLN